MTSENHTAVAVPTKTSQAPCYFDCGAATLLHNGLPTAFDDHVHLSTLVVSSGGSQQELGEMSEIRWTI